MGSNFSKTSCKEFLPTGSYACIARGLVIELDFALNGTGRKLSTHEPCAFAVGNYQGSKFDCNFGRAADYWRLQQATKEGEAQREGVKGEGGAGGNNLESSFSTLTVKDRKHRAPDNVFVVDTECEGDRGHGLLYRPGSSVNDISLPEVVKKGQAPK